MGPQIIELAEDLEVVFFLTCIIYTKFTLGIEISFFWWLFGLASSLESCE